MINPERIPGGVPIGNCGENSKEINEKEYKKEFSGISREELLKNS